MMNVKLVAAPAAALALVLSACSPGTGPQGGAAHNPLLAYVPAETPYVLANLEPLPDEIVDAWFERARPVLDELQAESAQWRQNQASEPADDPAERLLTAVLEELEGKLDRAGLESLGFDPGGPETVYGLGAFPVMRVALSDPAALQAAIERVLARAALDAPQQNYQGVSYWRIPLGEDGEVPAAVYAAIPGDHLALAVLPDALETELLPLFLGVMKPDASDAAARLAALNQAHGYEPWGSGILDLERLADDFLQPGGMAARMLSTAGAWDAASLPPECTAEIHAILAHSPRMTLGITELGKNTIAYQYRAETPASLAKELMDLAARIPGVGAPAQHLLEFAVGLRVGSARDFLRLKAESIAAEPYRCELLDSLNEGAVKALEKLQQPLPPFVNNFRGLRMAVDELPPEAGTVAEDLHALVALHVEQPQMFVGMAQMMLPDLAALNLAPGEPPVRLPEDLLPLPGLAAWAMMSSSALGLSLGEGEQDRLPPYLDAENAPAGVFLTADYDTSAAANLGYLLHDPDPDNEFAKALSEAWYASGDRSRMTMRFAPDGLVIDERMEFKPIESR